MNSLFEPVIAGLFGGVPVIEDKFCVKRTKTIITTRKLRPTWERALCFPFTPFSQREVKRESTVITETPTAYKIRQGKYGTDIIVAHPSIIEELRLQFKNREGLRIW